MGDRPSTDTGYGTHQAQKWLNRMADDADIPDEVYRIILPSLDIATLLAPYMDEDITLLADWDGKLAIIGDEGNIRTSIPSGTQESNGTLDLRISEP